MLGVIMMGGSASLETQFHRNLPENIEMATTRVPLRDVSYQGLLEMNEKIPDAARILAEARPSVIAVATFTGSCIRGSEMVNAIQQTTGIPAIVPSLEFARVLHLLRARRIALVTRFSSELRILERVFFQNNLIEIAKVVEVPPLQQADPFEVSRIDYSVLMERLRQADLSGAEAVLIDLPTCVLPPELQEELDHFIHVPVLTLMRVLLWSALKVIGAPTEGLYLHRYLP